MMDMRVYTSVIDSDAQKHVVYIVDDDRLPAAMPLALRAAVGHPSRSLAFGCFHAKKMP